MKEEKKNVNKIQDDFNSLSSRIINLSGATASIAIITLILYALKIIPENISLAIGFFVSLPLVYSFIFGIITNRPNFTSVFRHYSFTAYLIIAFIIYMIVLKPISIAEGVKYSFHFLLGLILAIIGYFFYSMGYRLSKKMKIKMYRWLTLISFGVSFIITFIITFILKHYGVFELIS